VNGCTGTLRANSQGTSGQAWEEDAASVNGYTGTPRGNIQGTVRGWAVPTCGMSELLWRKRRCCSGGGKQGLQHRTVAHGKNAEHHTWLTHA